LEFKVYPIKPIVISNSPGAILSGDQLKRSPDDVARDIERAYSDATTLGGRIVAEHVFDLVLDGNSYQTHYLVAEIPDKPNLPTADAGKITQ
jgi:hypothetical protein